MTIVPLCMTPFPVIIHVPDLKKYKWDSKVTTSIAWSSMPQLSSHFKYSTHVLYGTLMSLMLKTSTELVTGKHR
jgi:hypothetical protein